MRICPDASNLRVVSEGPKAPLPPAGQPEQVPQPCLENRLPPAGMTLAELEEMAVRCNPTVAQAASRVEAARGRCVQVGLYPNPVAGYIGAEIGNEGQGGQQGSFVGQEIVTAGKLRLNRSVAEQEIRQAEWAWQSQRQRVLTDVRRSFYDVLVAQRTMELTEQLLRIGEEGVRSTESLMKAKEVARADVLQAQHRSGIGQSPFGKGAKPTCGLLAQSGGRGGRCRHAAETLGGRSMGRPLRADLGRHLQPAAGRKSATCRRPSRRRPRPSDRKPRVCPAGAEHRPASGGAIRQRDTRTRSPPSKQAFPCRYSIATRGTSAGHRRN